MWKMLNMLPFKTFCTSSNHAISLLHLCCIDMLQEKLDVSKNLKVLQSYEELEAAFEPGKEFCFDAAVHLTIGWHSEGSCGMPLNIRPLQGGRFMPGQMRLDLELLCLLVCCTGQCMLLLVLFWSTQQENFTVWLSILFESNVPKLLDFSLAVLIFCDFCYLLEQEMFLGGSVGVGIKLACWLL